MSRYIPLSKLKDTTGIVAICEQEEMPVIVNKNGEMTLTIMGRDVYTKFFRLRRSDGTIDVEEELRRESGKNGDICQLLIKDLKRPAEVVKLCEMVNEAIPIIRNGYDVLYVMSYKEYRKRLVRLRETSNRTATGTSDI